MLNRSYFSFFFEESCSSPTRETLSQMWHMAMISPSLSLRGPVVDLALLLTRGCVCAIAEIIDAHSFLFTVLCIVVQYDMLCATVFSRRGLEACMHNLYGHCMLKKRLASGIRKVHHYCK